MKFKIKRKKYNVKGSLAWEYNPFHNCIKEDSNKDVLDDFDTERLTLDINHPVDIQCQTSYDGSTNIIINDDLNPPRIVNSAFTVKEDNTFERVSRNQRIPTNIYREQYMDSETRVQRIQSKFTSLDLKEVSTGGELAGGNYVFLIQYADDDDNLSKVVVESGIVCIFSGHLNKPYTSQGTLLHEKTDKLVRFNLLNIDESFSKVYVSYRRDYCDLNGIKQSEYKKISSPYKIKNTDTLEIIISGRESTVDTSFDEIISQTNVYSKVKTHAQNQNILFFGNVEETYDDVKLLQTLALQIQVCPEWGGSIGYLDQSTFEGSNLGSEYFNTHNIYDNLGYMPEEYYRIGVVFIYEDDRESSVYNLRGCEFSQMGQWNFLDNDKEVDINELFISTNGAENTKGIFRMPYVDMYSSNSITPITLRFRMPYDVIYTLASKKIKGYYYVRQPRIPVFLAQGFSVGVSKSAYIPMLSVHNTLTDENGNKQSKEVMFGTDSIFVRNQHSPDEYKKNGKPKKNPSGKFIYMTPTRTSLPAGENTSVAGLVCPDAFLNRQLQSMFVGNNFKLRSVGEYQSCGLFVVSNPSDSEDYDINKKINLIRTSSDPGKVIEKEIMYIAPETPYMSYKQSVFSTKCGSSMDVKSLRSVSPENSETSFKLNSHCVRGNYMSFLGICSENSTEELEPNSVYNIYTSEYGNSTEDVRNAVFVRSQIQSSFTAICTPQSIKETVQSEIVCARGDCFTCTTGHKFVYNFLDSNAPLNETMVKSYIQFKDVKKAEDAPKANQFFDKTVDELDAAAWSEWNASDMNVVDIGQYITVKYMSNFNNIRSTNTQNLSEISLFGSPRSFWPLQGAEHGVAFKIPESSLVNAGLSSTQTVIPHFEAIQIPYVNSNFDNRIAFSRVSQSGSFSNGYRVFSGVSYQDIERTYGAIVKLLPYGSNLFCVFEHGCGIVPVNEKALLSTTTGQSVHLYGAGVLQEQVTVVSQDYGSTWEDSIITTPNGIYGVDTWAKKIWRFNGEGFKLISDQLVQRFLNDGISLQESDTFPYVGIKNIKSHYNNYKGDVMFTFYNKGRCWNLCYNERAEMFITKYSWIPAFSENIQNSFISINNSAISPYAHIAKNKISSRGLILHGKSDQYTFDFEKKDIQYNSINLEDNTSSVIVTENCCKFARAFRLVGYDPCNYVSAKIKSVTYPTWDENNNTETLHTITNDTDHGFWIPEYIASVPIPIDDDEKDGDNIDLEIITDSLGNSFINKKTLSKYKVSAVGWGYTKHPVQEEDVVSRNGKLNNNEYYLETVQDDIQDNERDSTNWTNFNAKWNNSVACYSGTDLNIEVKLDEFVSWLKLEVEITPKVSSLTCSNTEWGVKSTVLSAEGTPFTETIYFVANYDFIKNKISDINLSDIEKIEYKNYKNICDKLNRIGFYTHGRAGIYDELNYQDSNSDNQIKPTFWYNKQEPFEFEFVVNTPSGLQKIFNNLIIISNNVEPQSLEVSLIGDVYNFNKAGIFNSANTTIKHDLETGILNLEELEKEKLKAEFANTTRSQNFEIQYNVGSDKEIKFHTSVIKDEVLNQYMLKVIDNCRNAKDPRWGKRLGNIEYREDKWLVTLSPIIFKNKEVEKDEHNNPIKTIEGTTTSAKLRDKWCKVRIKYSGDKLVVISAIQTLLSLSFS